MANISNNNITAIHNNDQRKKHNNDNNAADGEELRGRITNLGDIKNGGFWKTNSIYLRLRKTIKNR